MNDDDDNKQAFFRIQKETETESIGCNQSWI